MRNTKFFFFLMAFLFLMDLYVFQAIKAVTPQNQRYKSWIYAAYWIVSVSSLVFILLQPFTKMSPAYRNPVFAIIMGLFLFKLVISLFLIFDDLRRLSLWGYDSIFQKPAVVAGADRLSRSAFLSWMGLGLGGTLFSTLLYGFNNKYNYQVKKVKLQYPNLPAGFKGLKLVHISDIHSGSFNDKQAVMQGVAKILKLNPDLILFTGDLVNDRATEMDEYKEVFSRLKAPLGVYSVLGNHDYGDYVAWESAEAKHNNLEALKQVHASLGWKLLMNEHVVLEKGGDAIALLGIENWGAKGRFPKYGKMNEAHPGTEPYPFKILMSHDPSHWEAQVLKEYKDIDLMLSGHTHGMQFGVELPGFRWSPVQYMYQQWAGLYEYGTQKLYVNRGFGFLGYPGRVGILPEITLIELA